MLFTNAERVDSKMFRFQRRVQAQNRKAYICEGGLALDQKQDLGACLTSAVAQETCICLLQVWENSRHGNQEVHRVPGWVSFLLWCKRLNKSELIGQWVQRLLLDIKFVYVLLTREQSDAAASDQWNSVFTILLQLKCFLWTGWS